MHVKTIFISLIEWVIQGFRCGIAKSSSNGYTISYSEPDSAYR